MTEPTTERLTERGDIAAAATVLLILVMLGGVWLFDVPNVSEWWR
jgi:hypothetical protein